MLTFISHDNEKHHTIALNVEDVSPRPFENQPIMTLSNFALRCHEDIDYWVFYMYHLKDVCHMCRRRLNHFPWINAVPCDIVVDVNVNFYTWIAWQRQIFGSRSCDSKNYHGLSNSFLSFQCDQVFWKFELNDFGLVLWQLNLNIYYAKHI